MNIYTVVLPLCALSAQTCTVTENDCTPTVRDPFPLVELRRHVEDSKQCLIAIKFKEERCTHSKALIHLRCFVLFRSL